MHTLPTQLRSLCLCLLFACLACQSPYDPESHWEEGELGVLRQGMTVGEVGGCSTSIVNALSEQLIEEINCLRPNTLREFTGPNMSLGSAVFPFLQAQGPEDLADAIAAQGGTLTVTSALRTLPQQFLLYRWKQQGRCNIALAARPGRSRHESGLAIDISGYSSWITPLTNHDFEWFGDRDPVHFDYQGDGITDLAGLSVRAFQQLWNRNHPEDLIAEDGIYGPQTEARITMSPAAGFEISGCEPEQTDAAIPEDMMVPIDAQIKAIDAELEPDIELIDQEVEEDIDAAEEPDDRGVDAEVDADDFADGGGTLDAQATSDSVDLDGGCTQTTGTVPFEVLCLMMLIGLSRRFGPSRLPNQGA